LFTLPLTLASFEFRVTRGESTILDRGRRGIGGGTGTGGGGGDGNKRGNRYTSIPNCFLTALNSALALQLLSGGSLIWPTM